MKLGVKISQEEKTAMEKSGAVFSSEDSNVFGWKSKAEPPKDIIRLPSGKRVYRQPLSECLAA